MSSGAKFWGRRASGNNRVITRDYGVIPNITKAQDVFVSIPLETMQAATAARADKFCSLLMNLKHDEFMNHPFHYENVTTSIIANPSNPGYKDW